MLTLSLEISFLNFEKVFYVWLSEYKRKEYYTNCFGMIFEVGNENVENLYSLK